MNLRIITKNHADDSKIGFPLKIDFKAEWTHESMPTAWELIEKGEKRPRLDAWTLGNQWVKRETQIIFSR